MISKNRSVAGHHLRAFLGISFASADVKMNTNSSFLLLLFIPCAALAATTCQSCIQSGKKWCDRDGPQCDTSFFDCDIEITDAQNCPMVPDAAYAYSDSFARYTVLPLTTAVFHDDPTECLRNTLPTTTFYKSIKVPCDKKAKPNETCHCFTAFDHVSRTVIVSFTGAHGNLQKDEISLTIFQKKAAFYDHGHVYEYMNNAFFFLWNGGLQQAMNNLRYQYPDYSLVVAGHSLGGSLATVFASYIVKMNLYTPEKIKLVTLGQARTGDRAFAQWHDSTFPYSYRVVNHRDPVPHMPPMGGPDGAFHHRYEVWYNNQMKVGDPYTVCHEADGPYCSNTQSGNNEGMDHLTYFDIDMRAWAASNCAKNFTHL